MTAGWHRPLRLAHRGDWRSAPENSLAALEAALENPSCDGLEFDVRLARDRVPVLLHDATLARVHGRPDRVDAVDARDLAPAGIPTLAAALARIAELRADAFLDIELKGDDHGRTTADVLRDALGDQPRTAVVSSFEPETLRTMRAWLPRWSRWLNADDATPGTLELAVSLGCRGVSVELGALDADAMRRAGDAGLEVASWTARDPHALARQAALGVVATCVEAAALDVAWADVGAGEVAS